MKAIQHFILGIQFLTRIPLTKASVPCEPQDFKGAMSFFTFIGLIIGMLQWGVYTCAAYLFGPLMGAFLATLSGVWVTGGLHLDGLADLWDGFGANQDATRTLEIMKDSRVGAFGVIAIVCDLSLHMIGIYTLKDAPYLYILVPVCAKLGVCFLCYIGRPIKKGLGSLWIDNIGAPRLILNACITLMLCLCLGLGIWTIGIFVVTLGVAHVLHYKVKQKLGGINGDVLGACNQFVEWSVVCYCILYMNQLK